MSRFGLKIFRLSIDESPVADLVLAQQEYKYSI